MQACFKVCAVGVVHVPYTDEEVKSSWLAGGVNGIVEVFEEYAEGIKGLEGFSHIILITWLHKAPPGAREVIKVRHRRLTKFGIPLEELPEVGVFATDSPHRPNLIGLTVARVTKIEGRYIHVEGIDLFDGTPVLDIKPYEPGMAIKDAAVPAWYERLKKIIEEKVGKELRL